MRFFEEIAAREDRNLYEIVLYPEGLFYKAYERSAFACVSRVSPFKPSKKHIKYCARDMVSVGFPAAVLAKYFPAAPRPLPDGRVAIALKDRIDAAACEAWKVSLPLKERQPRGSARRMTYAVLPALKERPVPVRPAAPRPEMPEAPESKASMPDAQAPLAKLRAERDELKVGAAREIPNFRTARETLPARTERIVRLIREFRLEAATPVECVLFVADLKKEIDGYL